MPDHPPLSPTHLHPGLRRIALTGFMGAGKSTVGRSLAYSLGWRFLDLDTLIEGRSGDSIPNLFRTLGEPAFRRQESLALVHALGQSNLVIALGGGAPETLANRLLLEQTPGTRTVFLTGPFRVLFDRCMLQAAAGALLRPNLQDPLLAESRFHSRQVLYRRLANLTVDTSSLSPAEVTENLRTALASLPF